MMGMTASGCSTALLEEPFAFAADLEQDCELEALKTSAGGDNICPGVRTWVEGEEEDAPISEPCPKSVGLSQRSPRFSVSRSGTSGTAPPPEPEALPW